MNKELILNAVRRAMLDITKIQGVKFADNENCPIKILEDILNNGNNLNRSSAYEFWLNKFQDEKLRDSSKDASLNRLAAVLLMDLSDFDYDASDQWSWFVNFLEMSGFNSTKANECLEKYLSESKY